MVSVESIIKVQDQLEEYGKLIKALSKSDIQDFGVIVLQGGLVCESMLRVIIEDKGYPIDEKGLVRSQDRRFRGGPTPLSFVYANEDILPKECREFVSLIRIYRNQAAHIPGTDYDTAVAFAKALDYFVLWFDDYLTTHNIIGEEDTKKFEDRDALVLYLENVRDLEVVKYKIQKLQNYCNIQYRKDINNHPTMVKQPEYKEIPLASPSITYALLGVVVTVLFVYMALKPSSGWFETTCKLLDSEKFISSSSCPFP